MKTAVIYCSNKGKSFEVATTFNLPYFHINENPKLDFEFIIIVCPTTGDDELPDMMEKFLLNLTVRDKLYTIIELGNYFGYENNGYGPARIIQFELNHRNWQLAHPILSLDAFPEIDNGALHHWKQQLCATLKL